MNKVAVLIALIGCGKHHEKGQIDREAAKGVFEEVVIDTPPGMSDLSIDARGVMWAVAERDRVVLELELGKPPIRHPLEGVPGGTDAEGLAWLADGQFAIGIEGNPGATAGILFAELHDQNVVVTRTRMLTDAELGVQLIPNHGIEAVCGHGDELLAACETVGTLPDGTRWAPLVRLRGDGTTLTKLHLTTSKGKISALHCTFAPDGSAEVLAIERHYAVSRILKFSIKRGDTDVTPTVLIDLEPILRDSLNLEGITRLPDGRIVAINDNQGSSIYGPTELLVFAPR